MDLSRFAFRLNIYWCCRMSSPTTALPSVSSLLKWARGEAEPEKKVDCTTATNKRAFSNLVEEEKMPRPLTAAIIQRATEELPQGAGVALESCLTAFKVTIPPCCFSPSAPCYFGHRLRSIRMRILMLLVALCTCNCSAADIKH